MPQRPKRRRPGQPRVDDLFYDNPDPAGPDDPDGAADDGGADDSVSERNESPQEEARVAGLSAGTADPDAETETGGATSPHDSVAPGRRRVGMLGRVARAGAVVGVAAALVYAAGSGRVETLDLATALGQEAVVPDSTSQPAGLAVLTEASIGCVGPERVGLDDPTVTEPEQVVSVTVGAAPREALPDGLDPTGVGQLRVSGSPQGETESGVGRGEPVILPVSGDTWARGSAQGALAAGFAGSQLGLSLQEQERGLTMAACQTAREDTWLVGGGAEPGRVERLILANPTGNAVTADVEVLGAEGRVSVAGGRGIVVPAGERQVLLLDALAPGEARPVVHVRTTGGPVLAALADRWLEGTLDRGTELITPAAPPADSLVIPAVPAGGGAADSASVRIAVPGDEEAVVQLRALTPEGPTRLRNAVTTVEAGAVADVDVSDLPPGTHAIEVEADTPVVAAAQVDRRAEPDGVSDLAWVPAVQVSTDLVGAPLAHQGSDPLERAVTIASLEGAQVEVTAVTQGVAETQSLDVPAAGSATVVLDPETESVWVRAVSGAASSAVVSTLEDDSGTLIAGTPLPEAALTRQVRSVAPWHP